MVPRGSWSVRGHEGSCGGGEHWRGDVILDPRFNDGGVREAAGSQGSHGGPSPFEMGEAGAATHQPCEPRACMEPPLPPPKQPPPGNWIGPHVNVPPGPPGGLPPPAPGAVPSAAPPAVPSAAAPAVPSAAAPAVPSAAAHEVTTTRRAEDEAAEARAAQKAKASPPESNNSK